MLGRYVVKDYSGFTPKCAITSERVAR
jgi:hypothetical protein